MPRVLLVDDEAPFSRALHKMIEQVDSQYSVVGVAFDGEQALELLPALLPDVLITDIRMPVMDGLQLIDAIKRRYPELVSVIVSSYDDFNYTRKAIQLGADDYLLKPLTVPDLQELLVRVKCKVEEHARKREMNTLRQLIDDGGAHLGLPASLSYDHYTLLVACAGSYSKAYVDPMHPGKVFWQSRACEAEVQDDLPEGAACWLLEGDRENERIVVIGSRFEIAEDSPLTHLVSTKLQSMAEGFGITLTLVAAPDLSQWSQLRPTFLHLSRKLVKSVVFGKSSFVLGDTPARQRVSAAEGASKLESFIETRQQDAFFQGLLELCHTWESEAATQLQLDTTLRHLVFVCKEKLKSITEDDLIQTGQELDSLLSHSSNYEELYEGASYLFRGLLESAGASSKSIGHQDDMVGQIERYLQEHYALPITLQDLSKRFGLVPNYLSSLFKKLRGHTPGEYLTQWRVIQAKKMMDSSPNLLLKDISELVGYSDPLYFSRVFKKTTGISPSDYMK
jgi:two-component system response regulator YesN